MATPRFPLSKSGLPALGGALALGLLVAAPAQAADNPGIHSHGQAQLQVALEPPRVELMLVSPAANLVGFEHLPRSEAQRREIETVRDWLGSNPLVESGQGCRLVNSEVSDGFGEAGAEHGHHDHHADHHDHHDKSGDGHQQDHHGDHHKHGHHDHHKSHDGHGHHDDHDHGKAEHREFRVAQQLECSGAMESFSTGLMQRFPGIEELQVEWLGPDGQGSARLEQGDSRFVAAP